MCRLEPVRELRPHPTPPLPLAGRQSSGVLLGLQVPPEDSALLQTCIAELGAQYTFTELGKEGKEVFDMFIS